MASIGFVPVRIGSKSIPKKNLMPLFGKPLLAWVLKALQQSNVDKIIVYGDSDEFFSVVKEYPKAQYVIRSPESATDTASTEFAMIEYLRFAGLDYETTFLLVQATNPWVIAEDINRCLDSGMDTLTVAKTKYFYWDPFTKASSYYLDRRPRRQDHAGLYIENGAVYKSTVGNILKHGCRLTEPIGLKYMPEYTKLEIDEPIDLVLANAMCEHFKCAPPDLRGRL